MTRRLLPAALALGLTLGAATPAVASGMPQRPAGSLAAVARADSGNTRLMLSDSATGPWAPQLGRPLFGGAPRIVPGGSVGDTIWVRNASADDATLTVRSVVDAQVTADPLSQELHVHVVAGEEQTSASPADPTAAAMAGSDQLLASTRVAAGAVVPVAIAAHLPWESDNSTQEHTWRTPLTISLGMTQALGGEAGPVEPPSGTSTATPSPAPTTSTAPRPGAAGSGGTGSPSDGSTSTGTVAARPGDAPATTGPSAGTGTAGDAPQAGGAPGGGSPSGGLAGQQAGPLGGAGQVPQGAAYGVATSPVTGALAHTGADAPRLLLLGGSAIGLGALLLALARRRREEEDETA